MVVTTLFDHPVCVSSVSSVAIHTTTRVQATFVPRSVYADARKTTSTFTFRYAVPNTLVDESVLEQDIKIEVLQSRFKDALDSPKTGTVVAVDHLEKSEMLDGEALISLYAGPPSKVSWLAVGRTPSDETVLTDYATGVIRFEPYQGQVLVDVLMMRASAARSR